MSAMHFAFTGSPAHIVFGRGAVASLKDTLDHLGCTRALVLATEFQADQAREHAAILGKSCLGVYAKAAMHTPVEVTEAAMEVIAEQRVDCVISFGGGSTIGLGKAIAWRTDLPQIAVPTTYAGSEVTNILGQTENGEKTTLKSAKVIPEAVIYDPEMTLTLPKAMSITSGINALAHAVEALYAQDCNPIASMMAAEGARAIISALPEIHRHPDSYDAREKAFYGSWLCGSVLGQVGMALHHKICHTLGGGFDLPHAETHTVMLPHATHFNEPAVGDRLTPISEALGGPAGEKLWEFARALDAPMTLKDLGMPEDGIAKAADMAMGNPYWNPRPLERDSIEAMIRAAYHGEKPET